MNALDDIRSENKIHTCTEQNVLCNTAFYTSILSLVYVYLLFILFYYIYNTGCSAVFNIEIFWLFSDFSLSNFNFPVTYLQEFVLRQRTKICTHYYSPSSHRTIFQRSRNKCIFNELMEKRKNISILNEHIMMVWWFPMETNIKLFILKLWIVQVTLYSYENTLPVFINYSVWNDTNWVNYCTP